MLFMKWRKSRIEIRLKRWVALLTSATSGLVKCILASSQPFMCDETYSKSEWLLAFSEHIFCGKYLMLQDFDL